MKNFKKAFQGKNILITGGLGFIGSNLAHRLAELDARLMLVDSLIPDYGGNLFNIQGIKSKVQVKIGDIRNQHTMNYLVQERDYIFNLAGQVSHLDSMQDPYTDLEINCRAQLSLLEMCRKYNSKVKIVYSGTRQVYGKPLYLPVDEKHLLRPTDVNGINKMAGEWYHILYNNVYGIRAVSLRLTNTYGPRQLMKHNRQGFIPWFIRLAIEGKEIQIYGDGQQKRDLNYIDDVCDAMLLAAASDKTNGKVYNLGSSEVISVKDLTELIISIAKSGTCKLVSWPSEKKKIDIGDYYADFSKIKKELKWQPKTSLKEGLEKTIEYYKRYLKKYL